MRENRQSALAHTVAEDRSPMVVRSKLRLGRLEARVCRCNCPPAVR